MEKSLSKVIPSEELDEIQEWAPPSIEHGGPLSLDGPGTLLTAAQLEKVYKQAYEEGFEQGKKEGFSFGHKEALVEGRKQLQETMQGMETLFHALETPFNQLDDQVEQELVTLAIAIVKQLVRREVKTDPGHILGVVREAIGILPVSSRNVRLVLHPEDAEMVRKVYATTETELGWKIVEDPVLARGGCRVLTDTSQVDATLESRLTSLIAPMLGGERSQEDSIEDEES